MAGFSKFAYRGIFSAQEKSRTSTPRRAAAPEAAVSTIPPPGHCARRGSRTPTPEDSRSLADRVYHSAIRAVVREAGIEPTCAKAPRGYSPLSSPDDTSRIRKSMKVVYRSLRLIIFLVENGRGGWI